MPIPNYPLLDAKGRHVLSRDPRFNHPWFSSRVVDPYDNDTHDQMSVPRQASVDDPRMPDVCFLPDVDSIPVL